MGNCQAAEAATVVIERPGGKVERIYWSVSANEVMKANPGNYVAVIIASIPSNPETKMPTIKQLKLLRPEDTLHIGHVYRLVSFEEVLKELSGRKQAKLSKMVSLQKQKQWEMRETTARESVARPQRIDNRPPSNVQWGIQYLVLQNDLQLPVHHTAIEDVVSPRKFRRFVVREKDWF